MKNLKLFDGHYYVRFHYNNAFSRWNEEYKSWDFISYNTLIMRIFRIVNTGIVYYVCVDDYRGTTTQKHISQYIFEMCGHGYYLAYKKARYFMRKNGGIKLYFTTKGSGWVCCVLLKDGTHKVYDFNI